MLPKPNKLSFGPARLIFIIMIVFMNCFVFINSRYRINIANNYIKITIVVEVAV